MKKYLDNIKGIKKLVLSIGQKIPGVWSALDQEDSE